MRGRHAIAWFAFLALVPLAGSSSPAADDLHASSATLEGSGSATASLAGLVIEGPSCATIASMSLAAGRGSLELDNETTAVVVTPAVGTPSENTREAIPLSGAVLDGFDLRGGCRLLALPASDSLLKASASLGASHVALPTGIAAAFEPRASFDRDTMEVPTGMMSVEVTGSATVQLQAPFRLVVWEASFLLHEDNRTRTVQTGVEAQPLAPSPVPAQRNVQREAYLRVDQGTLAVALGPGARLYAASMQLDLQAGRLQLHDPEGILPLRGSPIPSGSQLLELAAPATTLLTPSEGQLGAAIQGDPSAVYLDGEAVMGGPAPDDGRFVSLAALGMATLAGAALFAARSTARHQLGRLDGLMTDRHYPEALALARKAQRHWPIREEARLAEATCLIQMARFAEARDALDGRNWSPTSGPLRDYLLANVEAGSGRKALAARHLTECLLRAPDFAMEALANPLLAPVVHEVLAASRVPREGYA